jgi:hypothetical protein
MKLFLLFFILNIIFLSDTIGQCVARGKVTDKNGEALIGVAVYPKSNMSAGVITDLNGDYSLKLNHSGSEIIEVSYVGYKIIDDTVKCISGVLINNYLLESSVQSIKTLVVKGKATKNNDAQLEMIKVRSTSTIDYISAETIKKTGDANVASAVSRITGVSSNSGGLITVRGIGDRYLKTTINGSRIPTLDPFTNNIKLDLFPSSLIDNIIITKTASPDLPGDWAGAYISVETKDYPDTLSVNLETSFGYNQQTSFKDIVSSQKSSTDWLGYDNGFRDQDHNQFVNFNGNPTAYQEMVALGLGNYYNSIGVTSSTSWNDTYYKLGLIQLGLLGPAQMNDPAAFQNANETYNTLDYKGHAFDLINAEAVKSEKMFPNNWNTVTKKAPLNNSQIFSIGNQTMLFGKPLGFLFGFRYASSIQDDPNSVVNKISSSTIYSNEGIPLTYDHSIYQETSKETNGWSGLVKLAYKMNSNNSVSLLFMPNFTGVNNVRSGLYQYTSANEIQNDIMKSQFYESRKQIVYQLKSEHYLPFRKIKIECNASYTRGKSDAPDFKIVRFSSDTTKLNNPIFDNSAYGLGRSFRYLKENILDTRISAEIPLYNRPELVRKLKIGAAFLNNNLENKHYFYQLLSGKGIEQITAANPNSDPYGQDRFDIVTVIDPSTGLPYRSVQEFYYREPALPSEKYFGRSNIVAGFAMIDYSIIPSLRFSGGLRAEKAFIYTDCFLFDSLGLAADDGRRIFIDGGSVGKILVNPGELNKLSILPSANLIYKLNHNEEAPVNLRFNFSKTVARPSIRELSDNGFFDYELNSGVQGNSKLKIVQVNNFDLRFESYFKSEDNISVSIFYKTLKHHIELMHFDTKYMWINNDNKSWLEGIEIEGKKKIYTWLELRANITLIKSVTKIKGGWYSYGSFGNIAYYGAEDFNRPLFGQAPYVINSMLSYNSKKLGFVASVNYNVQGSRLVILGPNSTIPDIYELPRHLIDLKLAKKIGRHLNLSLKVLDVLNSPILRSYSLVSSSNYFKNLWNDVTRKNKYILTYDKYRYGTNYIISLAYKL